MTEMDWTRPPSNYVVVDGETGERFEIDDKRWPVPDANGHRSLGYDKTEQLWFWLDGRALHTSFRLALRSEVEKPDPTIVERLRTAIDLLRRWRDGGIDVSGTAMIYDDVRALCRETDDCLAASLAEWRG